MSKQLGITYNDFGMRLGARLVQDDPNSNVFFSPASIALALAMLYNGANDKTRQAMARTLGIDGIDGHDWQPANAKLVQVLNTVDPSITLTIANSLWARPNVTFVREFVETNQSAFQAQIRNLVFSDPAAASIINSWVEEKTNQRIKNLLSPAEIAAAILVLVNAIYFKGQWEDPFDVARTRLLPFTCANGNRKQHPLMSQSGEFGYYDDDQVQVIHLPYTERKIGMIVVLPRENLKWHEFLPHVTTQTWNNWLRHIQPECKGEIVLPRFRIEYDKVLNEPLSDLGMDIIFDGKRADFSRMVSGGAYVSLVKHKSFVEVNEEGSEAAAATAVVVLRAAFIEKPKPFRMVVDRPFLFAIRDNRTRLILFMGYVADPIDVQSQGNEK